MLKKINRLAEKMKQMADDELQAQTDILKSRLEAGEAEDAVMPWAYAAMREAMKRILHISLFDVQILGAVAMYQGKIAEMKTGEGKTFTAVLPLYMNALTGKSSILVTTNSYLAIRDGSLLEPLYRWMGISLSVAVREDGQGKIQSEEKKEIYAADIVYTTSGALGFDYLMENLSISAESRYLREFDFVVIDEADSVLLDAAQTPLVISGAPKVQSNLYDIADYFVKTLKKGDYRKKDKDVWLTPSGMEKAERFFDVPDLYDGRHYEFVRHIMLALRANIIFEKDRQYVVENEEIRLLDAHTGRILERTKLQAGQHQALEAKEGLAHTRVDRAMASITFQDFFNMFPKIAGMTGTAVWSAAEFKEIYGLDVIRIPTNRKVIRKDLKDRCFTSLTAQLEAAMEWIGQRHETGQPVLVIAESIVLSDIVSELLLEMEIPHNLLNAHNIAKEAEIIAEAGQLNAVTVATSVAGRGTDIKLGKGVAELGGLAVAGIGKMENRRLEFQARGRAGRQGDPGVSRFFVSLQDRVVAEHGKRKLQKHTGKDREIRSPRLKKGIARAQRVSEENGRSARRSTLIYGESIRLQREKVYEARRKIQNMENCDKAYYMSMEREVIREFLGGSKKRPNKQKVIRFILDNITYSLKELPKDEDIRTKERAEAYMMQLAERQLEEKLRQLDTKSRQNKYFQMMTLKAVDESWIEEVDYLQQLKAAMTGRQFTQRNMMFDYHLEAYRAYQRMQKRIKKQMMRNILLGDIEFNGKGELQAVLP